ncbi:hypothetical protein CDL15_Pgr018691 [Punica granatum]|nr:hypothetical protein CDL15_Pgr018691 [Punica granatum]
MDSSPALSIDYPSPIPKTMIDPNHNPDNCQLCLNPSPVPSPNPTLNFDDAGGGWGYCTEEQLEDILMKNLEFFYNEALSRLVSLGYDEDTALRAVLRNGYCYGGMDVLTNILHNALAYLKRISDSSGSGTGDDASNGENEYVFSDLRHLQEYSLAGMVCLMQQLRPHLSRGDAMWCLLMSDLHVGRASAIEIPIVAPQSSGSDGLASNTSLEGSSSSSAAAVGVPAPQSRRFHSGWGFGNNGVSEFPSNESFPDIECPKRFNLSPAMKALLKRNVAEFAAGFRSNSKYALQPQPQAGPSSLSTGEGGVVSVVGLSGESKSSKTLDSMNSVLSKFQELKLDEKLGPVTGDQKDEMILSLLHKIKDLERQVKERKEWAHEKAMQAAKKLSSDLTELKVLRMEMEETQRLKKGKQTLEETTMKRLSEMEDALRKASGQVDRANAAVRRLETENAEIRAEMEASKLSASESVTSCLEVAKREKKCLKRLLAWERQKTKLQEEIDEEKGKISELRLELVQLDRDSKEAEVKWKQVVKEKELTLAQVEEERRSKEATEASNKRKLEALRLKIEIDFQRHKDDLKRLEQELSRLRSSVQSTDHSNNNSNLSSASQTAKFEAAKPKGGSIARLLNQLDSMEDSTEINVDRRCLLCKKHEVSVVFLPCAHQVICSKCSENYGKKGKATCPCCRVLIEKKIRVFGASS